MTDLATIALLVAAMAAAWAYVWACDRLSGS
jgi:hypothetical protein